MQNKGKLTTVGFALAFTSLPLMLSIAMAAAPAPPKANFEATWRNLYPTSSTMDNVEFGTGKICQLCHMSDQGGDGWNAYGWRMRLGLNAGMTLANAIRAAEPFDSDMDPTGTENLGEIQADTQPGWTVGPNNTWFFKNGSTVATQTPPTGILGELDPSVFSSFCTAKTTTTCGPASIGASGTASATATSGFVISAGPTRGCRSGLLLYSNQATVTGAPFGGPGDGVLCLFPQGLRRAGPIDSGGTSPAVCDGTMSIDVNSFAQGSWGATGCNPPPGQNNPANFLKNIGTAINAQVWGRDSLITGQVLSDGVGWTVGP